MKKLMIIISLLTVFINANNKECKNSKECLEIAVKYDKEDNKEIAEKFYRKGCDLSSEKEDTLNVCEKYGDFQQKEGQPKKARNSYQYSCSKGNLKSCEKAKEMRLKTLAN